MKRFEIRDAPEATVIEFERIRAKLCLPRGEMLRRLLILWHQGGYERGQCCLNPPPTNFSDKENADG